MRTAAVHNAMPCHCTTSYAIVPDKILSKAEACHGSSRRTVAAPNFSGAASTPQRKKKRRTLNQAETIPWPTECRKRLQSRQWLGFHRYRVVGGSSSTAMVDKPRESGKSPRHPTALKQKNATFIVLRGRAGPVIILLFFSIFSKKNVFFHSS